MQFSADNLFIKSLNPLNDAHQELKTTDILHSGKDNHSEEKLRQKGDSQKVANLIQ